MDLQRIAVTLCCQRVTWVACLGRHIDLRGSSVKGELQLNKRSASELRDSIFFSIDELETHCSHITLLHFNTFFSIDG